MNSQNKGEGYLHNWISVAGGILAVVFFAAILSLILMDFFAPEGNPYLPALAYLIAPAFLVTALLMIPLGAWRERRQRVKGGHVRAFPRVDFNDVRHQKIAFVTIGVVTVFALFSVFGSYHAYEFTESTTFCGQVCHAVMEPEYTAYQFSPHARVACAECHVGSGADWYMRSKVSGMRQLYSVVSNTYHRPIPTPIETLRPAQETCEKCHWPQKYHGEIQKDLDFYLPDEANTHWKTRLLLQVGGGKPLHGETKGIHWHMNLANKVDYLAKDKKRQEIPWVRVRRADGTEDIYVDEDSGFQATPPPSGEMRRMDCMDCHNRPAHHFMPPSKAVNEAMGDGFIDKALPFIKKEAVEALIGTYESHEQAEQAIRSRIETFYREKYPVAWKTKRDEIDRSIQEVIALYKRNFFPEMGVSWKAYPDNIGHSISPGCFRCHSGRHKTLEGKTLSNECSLCHQIIEQGPAGATEKSLQGLEFKHPEDIDELWKETACFDCHNGENA